jgi:hypothetical protein
LKTFHESCPQLGCAEVNGLIMNINKSSLAIMIIMNMIAIF